MYNNKTFDIKKLSNINSLCRVCLSQTEKTVSLNDRFEEKIEENISKIWQMLNRVTSLKISLDSRYPSRVCLMCMKLAKAFYKFKLQFEKSQQVLGTHLKEELVELDNSEVVPVELISRQGKFDLQDVLIVEQGEEEPCNYDGFLNNLGTEVSASFVNDKSVVSVEQKISSIANNACSKNNNNDEISNNENKTDLPDKMINVNTKDVNDVPVMCSICEKTFVSQSQLTTHVNTRRCNKKQIYVCEICGIVLKSKSSHRSHHMLKHGEKKNVCSVCQKRYSNSSALQLHISAVHKNMRTHLCTICGKQFNYGNALTYHMRIHTDERNYKCTYCDKAFRIQCGLDRHLRTHTGIRPYKCSYCEKAFRSKGEVDCHETTHTGYRPYHCKYCKKGFTKTYNLKLHLLSHKGQYYCTVCNRTFIELEFLNIHMQCSHSKHGIIDEDA